MIPPIFQLFHWNAGDGEVDPTPTNERSRAIYRGAMTCILMVMLSALPLAY